MCAKDIFHAKGSKSPQSDLDCCFVPLAHGCAGLDGVNTSIAGLAAKSVGGDANCGKPPDATTGAFVYPMVFDVENAGDVKE